MNVLMMWCRSEKDNIIAIGDVIPWDEPEDKQNFINAVEGEILVMGRRTYECMDDEFLRKHKIYIMSSNLDYEVIDLKKHKVISAQKELKDEEGDLFIAGGKDVYNLFLTGKEALKPHIVVDCVYEGEIDDVSGEIVDVSDSVSVIDKGYRRITPYYQKGKVKSVILVRKGEFVEQSILRKIVSILENGANIV